MFGPELPGQLPKANAAVADRYAAKRWGDNSRAAMLTKADIPALNTVQGSGAAVTAGSSARLPLQSLWTLFGLPQLSVAFHCTSELVTKQDN